MIVLIRCNSISIDPRVEKYLHYFRENNVKFKVIGWDRLGENFFDNNTIYFKRKSGYNRGGYKAIFDRFFWILFVIRQLIILRKNIKVIHGCDLDGAFPAICFKFLTRNKAKIIFDVFDWFSASLSGQNYILTQLMKRLEKISVKNSNEIIICEPERINQIPFKLKKEALVFPNIPSFSNFDFLIKENRFSFNNNMVTLSYVGGFYNDRFIDELLQIAEKGLINLLIAGFGDEEIENKCSDLSKNENIKYYGRVNYKEGLQIMFNSDVVYAMYCKTNKNHFFAAPNKFYEAMLLSKPIISNKGINLEKKIVNYGIGYVIDESVEELESLVKKLKLVEMKKKGKIANQIWNNLYKNKTSNFLNITYSSIIN